MEKVADPERWSAGRPLKYRIDLIEFEKLNEVKTRVAAPSAQEEAERSEPSDANQQIGRAEEAILNHILLNGFTTREEIAQKCSGQGIEIGVRSVSRYLKALAEKGLLRREGKTYLPTDLARSRERQDTL